jgi:hypothetical protein
MMPRQCGYTAIAPDHVRVEPREECGRPDGVVRSGRWIGDVELAAAFATTVVVAVVLWHERGGRGGGGWT